jgi:hypothetical protein
LEDKAMTDSFYYDATVYAGEDNIRERTGVGVKPPRGKEYYTCLRALTGQIMEYCFIHSMIKGTDTFQVEVTEHGPDGHLRRWSFDIKESEVNHYA